MESDKCKLRKPSACVNQSQLKLRHLVQISARNLETDVLHNVLNPGKSLELTKAPLVVPQSDLFYYTLHVTPMSSPFYTSEALPGPHIDWPDIELHKVAETTTTCIPGVVIRIWLKATSPHLVFTWGVYFRGLQYLGNQLPKENQNLEHNTLIFGFNRGFFTSPSSLLTYFVPQLPSKSLLVSEVSKSYTVKSFCRLHCTQRLVHKQGTEADRLRSEINALDTKLLTFHWRGTGSRGRSFLALENATKSNVDRKYHRELLVGRETAQFRISLLRQEKLQQEKQLLCLEHALNDSQTQNKTQSQELKEKYLKLRQDKEKLLEIIRVATDTKLRLLNTLNQLMFRRKQLISELSFIYPISQNSDGSFAIAGIRLPNSEEFAGLDEVSLSVALGYVAHVTQMLSYFLQVPPRYPVVQCGSRSRIVDQITRKLLDQDREFPLYNKGKDKSHFNYGVYLLNKNIAQLRWFCGLATQDLPATLPNLSTLLQLRFLNDESGDLFKHGTQRRLSTDSQNTLLAIPDIPDYEAKPKYNPVNPKELKGHRATRSLGGSEASLNSMIRNGFQALAYPFQPSVGRMGSSTSLESHRVLSSADGLTSLMMMDKAASTSPKEKDEVLFLPPISALLHTANLPLLKLANSSKSTSLDQGLDRHWKEGSLTKLGKNHRTNSFPHLGLELTYPNVPIRATPLAVVLHLPRLEKTSVYSQEELMWLAEPTMTSFDPNVRLRSNVCEDSPPVGTFSPGEVIVIEREEKSEENQSKELIITKEHLKIEDGDKEETIIEDKEKSKMVADLDDLFSSMTLRTEALANSSSSFKLYRARPPV